jgi:hypothetical protein
VLQFPAEIVSDFSRFHHVDDIGAMPSPRFFALAGELAHYDGAFAAAVRRLPSAPEGGAAQPVPVTAETMNSPAFAAAPGIPAVFSVAKAG